ncbi:MAG: hypothetical protein KKB30_10385 [Proteobacteria bacterium]|nr:hypothetical protein [Pseudomonadota bacterium]MBU1717044.1 hypothetical protein [Pseudomonadota bacterium]
MAAEIDIFEHINELINRNNVQIRSLDVLDQDLYARYLVGGKAILILRAKVYEKKVRVITEEMLEIESNELAGYVKSGDKLIVVLPGSGKKRFVLQGQVQNIFVDRFRVTILDPRFNQRFSGETSGVSRFWEVPEVVLLKLQNRELRLFRRENGTVIEHLSESESGTDETIDCVKLLATSPISGVLIDISCGGLCLRVGSGNCEHLAKSIVYVGLDFQGHVEEGDEVEAAGMCIKIFAIVRKFRHAPEGDYLHMMFVAQLPEACENFFPRLAGQEEQND